ncbi:MAG: hypothetical protein JRF52_10415, partial [Deltaproteobacteria bacterium]|nr:hypothetical protein [Deltaproteobacteria bacterium]
MFSTEELKGIYLLADLNEQMLEKFLPFFQSLQFNEGDIIFEEGEKAEN